MVALPDEILSLIIEPEGYEGPQWKVQKRFGSDLQGFRSWLLDSNATFLDLRTFCFVSKAFRRISQPILYRRFDRDECGPGVNPNQHMRLFLRTLLENPRLAEQVKEVALGRYDPSAGYTKQPPHMAILYRDDTIPHFSMTKEFLADLHRGSHDAEMVLFLSICPNIQTLSFTAAFQMQRESWLEKIIFEHWDPKHSGYLPAKPSKKRILPRLQYLGFEHLELEAGTFGPFHQLRAFLNLPRLTTFQGDLVNLMRTSDLPRRTNLRHVHLHNSLWDHYGVSALLQTIPGLETLELVAAHYNGHGEGAFFDLRFSALGAVLRQHGTSLRSLTIDARAAFNYDMDFGNYNPLLGSLMPLNQLRCLKVPLAQLASFQGNKYMIGGLEGLTESKRQLLIHSTLRQTIVPESVIELTLLPGIEDL